MRSKGLTSRFGRRQAHSLLVTVWLWLVLIAATVLPACGRDTTTVASRENSPRRAAETTVRADGLRPVEIIEAVMVSSGELYVNIDACNAQRNEVEVRQSAEEVGIQVLTTDEPGGDDCSDAVRVRLNAPLGDRTIFDDSTGSPVQVRPQK